VDKLYHRNEDIGDQLLDPTLELSIGLLRQGGMLVPRSGGFHDISRANSIRADGTEFRHRTSLTPKEKDRRLAEGIAVSEHTWVQDQVETEKEGKRLNGIPVELVMVDTGVPYLGGVLVARAHRERQETLAARQELTRVIQAAGGAVEAVFYDGLLRGIDAEAILLQGAMPFIPLHQPGENQKHVLIPDTAMTEKSRAHVGIIKTITHDLGTCVHELCGVDGIMKTVRPGENVKWDSTGCEVEDIEFHRTKDGVTPHVWVLVPCRGTKFRVGLDVRERREGHPKSSILNVWRPYPESETTYQNVKGWRSPVEGMFSAMKDRLAEDQMASRLKISRFQLDLIGYTFLYNTLMWDVHISQFTAVGSQQYTDIGREADTRRGD
jgi:hypothetical protein